MRSYEVRRNMVRPHPGVASTAASAGERSGAAPQLHTALALGPCDVQRLQR